jgi:hypothetical protein
MTKLHINYEMIKLFLNQDDELHLVALYSCCAHCVCQNSYGCKNICHYSVCDISKLLTLFHHRYKVAEISGIPVESKEFEHFLQTLESDDMWDEKDQFEKGYKALLPMLAKKVQQLPKSIVTS